ncbi:hypothetical protein Agabi119p4_5228 [Agaricus bisporus var. burnettii]|uniref:DUF6534 domain-containing protein n=1 Tax=Agaricus bisporus var. burnettii TaxID=192524 RepID=A0A8H7KI30_AGABI|nr:hypothetical protein Agabi119p4_5228 [Agaricus bisporus var. burnettii]
MRWLRNLVHVIFFLETAQTVMTVADGFHWFVYGFGSIKKLGEYFLANFDSPILCSIIALISQGVYCWRIYYLSRWKIPTIIIGIAALTQTAGGIGIGIVNQRLGTIEEWDPKFNVLMILWSTGSAVADTLIASIMTYLLLSSRPFESRKKRSTVMTKLIRLVIETNVASALVAVAVLLTTVITPIAPPKTSYFLCPGYVLGKLYSNSFITMLNNRRGTGNGGLDKSTGSNQSDNLVMERALQRNSQSYYRKPSHLPPITVAIQTETALRMDDVSEVTVPKSQYDDDTLPKPSDIRIP